MEQHPIPRQITTFEFKLIGFMTVKQFIYLIIFIPLAFVVFKIFPIPIINFFLAFIVGGLGVGLAFVPINDRPLDVWIKNLAKKLFSPTQYFYHKQNPPIYFLSNLYFSADPHAVMAHIDSREKLAAYLAKTQPVPVKGERKQQINSLFQQKQAGAKKKKETQPQQLKETEATQGTKKAFFTGIVKNHKLISLPGILIYVKDGQGQTLRLLKTNSNGVFATFNPLSPAEYIFELKDTRGTYFFDTMKIRAEAQNPKPIEFFSKELL